MSGIVGLLRLNGAAVDRRLLQQMTEFLAFRGPDALETWSDGPVGLGHALLRTTRESLREHQPASLDGQVWITADARVDARIELRQKLEAQGRRDLDAATDPELILHAYHVWGEACLEHLLGDFAFAIWDGRERRLFCARDHFGVKPFYYALKEDGLIFSNTLDCVRAHPAVSDDLNDLAIADFLLCDMNQDPATTAFADIRRLPPAHSVTWADGALSLNRYWHLPTDGRIRYQRFRDYIERFRELLRTAVEDRLRTDHVGILMSGGLDSTTIAATAQQVLSQEPAPFDLRAYTTVFHELIPDREGHYSGLVAEALGIPIHYLKANEYKLYERCDEPECHKPEPCHNPLAAAEAAQLRQVAGHSRLALSGLGGDNLLYYEWWPYVRNLLRSFEGRRLLADIARYIWSQRRIPLLSSLPARMKRLLKKQDPQPGYPPWLNPALAARLDLPARWKHVHNNTAPAHPVRPQAYQSFLIPLWQYNFETQDPGATRVAVEVRYPFFDLRLVSYCLAIAPVPWCADKMLLRAAVRGRLPEAVRRRPKEPLAGDPSFEMVRRGDAQWQDHFVPTPELARYVNAKEIPRLLGEQSAGLVWRNLRPVSLNYWLRDRAKMVYKRPSEDRYGTTRPQESQEEAL